MSPRSRSALDDELDDLLGELADGLANRHSFLKARADKRGNVRLTKHEVSGLISVLDDIAETQDETGYTLNVIAIAARNLDLDLGLSTADATALSAIALAQASRAGDNAERIRSLFSEIDRVAKPAMHS